MSEQKLHIICFRFARACVRQYTVCATPSVFYYIDNPYTSLFSHTSIIAHFSGGGGWGWGGV